MLVASGTAARRISKIWHSIKSLVERVQFIFHAYKYKEYHHSKEQPYYPDIFEEKGLSLELCSNY